MYVGSIIFREFHYGDGIRNKMDKELCKKKPKNYNMRIVG